MTPHKSNCFFQQFQITVIFSQFYHALVSWGPNGHSQCLKSRLLLYQKITLKQFYFIFKIRILLPFINCQWNTNGIKQNELSKLFIIGLLIFPNILKLKNSKCLKKICFMIAWACSILLMFKGDLTKKSDIIVKLIFWVEDYYLLNISATIDYCFMQWSIHFCRLLNLNLKSIWLFFIVSSPKLIVNVVIIQ